MGFFDINNRFLIAPRSLFICGTLTDSAITTTKQSKMSISEHHLTINHGTDSVTGAIDLTNLHQQRSVTNKLFSTSTKLNETNERQNFETDLIFAYFFTNQN